MAWRRWEGTTWGDGTMPYGPANPDATAVALERASWRLLRAVAPWALAAQAFSVLLLASESPSFGVVRHWFRAYLTAKAHNQPLPSLPTNPVGQMSVAASLTNYAVLAVSVLGVVAWLRFSVASMRVASSARYPQRHRPVSTSLLFFIPVAGPLVARAASRESLPNGHEGRAVLGAGWVLVAAGQLAWIGLYATVLATSSVAVAWVVASIAAVAWVAAAIALPTGLQSIADDHDSLGVRLGPSYS
jgi:hypothetical protein